MSSSTYPIHYVHKESASLGARWIELKAVLLQKKKVLTRGFEQKMNFDQMPVLPPHHIREKYTVEAVNFDQRTTWLIKPKNTSPKKVIFYLHGGAYIFNMNNFHWEVIEILIEETGHAIIMPDYPLAPQHTAFEAFDYITKAYDYMVEPFDADNIIFMGESAGAGLALGFAQQLKKEGREQPRQIILLAPWLDIQLNNPALKKLEKLDVFLEIDGLKKAAKAYAGEWSITDYRVSPTFGDLTGLGRLSLFIGTRDLFLADCRQFKDKLDKQGIAVNYFEYPNMFHAWMIITKLKESQHALKQVCDLVNKG